MGGPRKTRTIRVAFLSKGFIADETHHEMFWLVIGGKKTSIRTRISHGGKEYGDQLLTLMSRQIGLSKSELYRLIDCAMDGEKLRSVLVERGKVRLQGQGQT
ncbi:MAG TPA: hypothetical protein VMV30_00040 [Candidatus Lokiarchaeia archaeon]|jgi:hypothetical protein|nr:hypothetical protein [Candidatus Lokiarchaeia archaeon]